MIVAPDSFSSHPMISVFVLELCGIPHIIDSIMTSRKQVSEP